MSKNKKYAFIMGALMCISLMALDIGYSPATLTMNNAPGYEWNVDNGDQLLFLVETDYGLGPSIEPLGFEVTASGQDNMYGQWMDWINFTKIEFNLQSETMELGDDILQLRTDTDFGGEGAVQLAMYPGFVWFFAAPIMPVKDTDQTMNLTYWGGMFTNLTYGEPGSQINSWGGSFNLTEFEVDGNTLELYNSTTGHYCNMTYYNNGTLEMAEILVPMQMDIPRLINQTITRTFDASDIHPIDETDFQYPAWNSLIYDSHMEGEQMGQPFEMNEIISLNITTDQLVGGFPNYNDFSVYHEVNASEYIWNPVWFTWDRVNPDIDPSAIGVGNDYQKNIWANNEEIHSNMLYQPGTTGNDLNDTYGFLFIDYLSFYDTINIGADWLEYSNTSDNAFIYIEVFANGTTYNYTSYDPDAEGQQLQQYIYSGNSTMDKTNLTDSLVYNANVGDLLVYQFTNGTDYEYGKYNITSIAYGEGEEMGSISPAILVDASFSNWTAGTPGIWTPDNDPMNDEHNTNIGAQNEEKLIMVEGPWPLVFATGTTGQFYNDSFGPTFASYIEFDVFQVGPTSWNGSRALTDEWTNITWNADGIVTYLSYNITEPGETTNINLTASLVTVNRAPVFSVVPGASTSFEKNTTGHSISWTATDTTIYTATWQLLLNSTEIDSNVWSSGTPIPFVVDDYSPGSYNLTLVVNDGWEVIKNSIILDVTNALPDINGPATQSYPPASTGNTITWTITDSSYNLSAAYTIYRNSSYIKSDAWTSGTPIIQNVDGLAEGDYNYTIMVTDGYGVNSSSMCVLTVTPNIVPAITHPADVGYIIGATGNSISWTLTDTTTSSPTYTILRDGTIVVSPVAWTSGSPINYVIDGLAPGNYNITIIALDGIGLQVSDEVIVTVTNVNPTITAPADITYLAGATGNSISWTATDATVSSPTYSITRNGTIVVNATAWTSGTAIVYSVDGLSVGNYAIQITVLDGLGGSNTDSVIVTVTAAASTNTTTNSTSSSTTTGGGELPSDGIPGYPVSFLILASVSALLIFRKKFRS
jgi:hypothetical protein